MVGTCYINDQGVVKKWYVIDATDCILGRVSVVIANILSGKNKPEYSPNADVGDHVIIVNADKIQMTKNKLDTESFYYHTGHPGGIKERTRAKVLAGKNPSQIIMKTVKGMLHQGPLGYRKLTKLHVYAGPNHPHASQKPETLDVTLLNKRNKKK